MGRLIELFATIPGNPRHPQLRLATNLVVTTRAFIRKTFGRGEKSLSSIDCDFRFRTPAMIGDFFGGAPMGFRGSSTLDRLMILADDLDA